MVCDGSFQPTDSRALSQKGAMTEARSPAPFRLRGGFYTLIVLELIDPDDLGFYGTLRDTMAQAPNFYRNAPLVVDLKDLQQPRLNFAELVRRLRQCQFVPVGVQNGTDAQNEAAVAAGLSVLAPGGAAPQGAQPGPRKPATSKAKGGETVVVTEPVRSGQQIYSQGDLVVLAPVSPGAELLAEGHIHVYSALRGRALAGLTGDTSARIFCRALDPELVAVAGIWQVRDNLDEKLIGKPAQIYLDGDTLRFQLLG
jgi:septum site-determining protein MinC